MTAVALALISVFVESNSAVGNVVNFLDIAARGHLGIERLTVRQFARRSLIQILKRRGYSEGVQEWWVSNPDKGDQPLQRKFLVAELFHLFQSQYKRRLAQQFVCYAHKADYGHVTGTFLLVAGTFRHVIAIEGHVTKPDIKPNG